MAAQLTEVTLLVKWDDADDHPVNWDWPVLLDLPDRDHVTILLVKDVSD